jgi:hypothetical protein
MTFSFPLIKLLVLVRSILFTFLFLECMKRLYISLSKCKLEYASAVWNSILSTDANKLECIQQRFAFGCFNRFFRQICYSYSLFFLLEQFKFKNLLMRHKLHLLFSIQVYVGSKFSPSVLKNLRLRVLARYITDLAFFNVCSSTNCPSVRCALVANVCRRVEVFGAKIVLLNHIL